MSITVTLELRLKPESVPAARDVMRRALQDTRAFDGNLGTDVLVDQDDEAHWLIYDCWDTVEHDEAYRSFRAGEGRLMTASTARRACQNEAALPTSDRHGVEGAITRTAGALAAWRWQGQYEFAAWPVAQLAGGRNGRTGDPPAQDLCWRNIPSAS